MKRRASFGLLAIVALASSTTAGAGAGSCSGGSSFVGEVIMGSFAPGAVNLRWTVLEDGSIREYRLSRYPSGCSRPSCATRLGKIRAAGGGLQTYTVVDTAPPGIWWYAVEVVRTHGPSCTMTSAELVVEAPPACDPAALCAQARTSFAGEVMIGALAPGVELRWTAHAETGSGSYRLSRFNCASPRDCMTEVATVEATGSCGQVMLHSVTDTPSAGTWTYVLDVLDSGGRAACSLRLPAPASPVSSR